MNPLIRRSLLATLVLVGILLAGAGAGTTIDKLVRLQGPNPTATPQFLYVEQP
jgi:hypothetical protein